MTSRVLNQLIALSDDPDDISLCETSGQEEILLGAGLALALGVSSQAALDKLATVTAQAAANQRARNLKAVS